MKRKGIIGLLVSTLLVLALVIACAPAAAPTTPTEPAAAPTEPTGGPITLDFATVGPADEENFLWGFNYMKDAIEKATYGRAQVVGHHGGTLLETKDLMRGTAEGMADLAWAFPTIEPGVYPLQELFTLPGVLQSQAQSVPVLVQLHAKYPQFEEEFGPDIKLLSNMGLMTSDIHSTTPIRSLADMKGKTFVAQNEITVRALKLMGVDASVMAAPDVYVAAERGVVDGIVTAWGWIQSMRLYEVLPYHTELNICPMPFALVMNRATFEKFTPEEQSNLELIWHQLAHAQMNKNILDRIKQNETYLADQPMYVLPAEDYEFIKESVMPMLDEWAEAREAEGLPGKDILEDALLWADAFANN